MNRTFLLAAAFAIGGCDSIPSDPGGTADRVSAERRFRVGIVASPGIPLEPDRARSLLDRLSRATGARAALEPGAAEPLLTRLEEGGLDLVIGEFAEKSPWSTRVTFTEPIALDGPVMLAAAARNGENDWIRLVHREARAAAAE